MGSQAMDTVSDGPAYDLYNEESIDTDTVLTF